jgi:putative sporulation protein YtxC
VNFRIKEYSVELEDIVDKAVDAFLMEREYQEFIKLLRYFVDIQEPRLEAVHILPGFNNKYVLLDQLHNEITNDCIKEFLTEVPECDINYDDLLVSSLITLAPIRIYIHHANQIRNKELIETIKNVFLNKVILCSGCDLCKSVKINAESYTH